MRQATQKTMTALREHGKCSRNKSRWALYVNICICGEWQHKRTIKRHKGFAAASNKYLPPRTTPHSAEFANENSQLVWGHTAEESGWIIGWETDARRRKKVLAELCHRHHHSFRPLRERVGKKRFSIPAIVIFNSAKLCAFTLEKVGAACVYVFAGLFTKCQHFKHGVAVSAAAGIKWKSSKRRARPRAHKERDAVIDWVEVCVVFFRVRLVHIYACARTAVALASVSRSF